MFFPSLEVLRSIRDYSDLALYLSFPFMAGLSHFFFIIMCCIILASSEFSFIESRFRISGNLFEEKGMDSATLWGKK